MPGRAGRWRPEVRFVCIHFCNKQLQANTTQLSHEVAQAGSGHGAGSGKMALNSDGIDRHTISQTTPESTQPNKDDSRQQGLWPRTIRPCASLKCEKVVSRAEIACARNEYGSPIPLRSAATADHDRPANAAMATTFRKLRRLCTPRLTLNPYPRQLVFRGFRPIAKSGEDSISRARQSAAYRRV
jgi:hypothetical protein